jgi:succinyl-CoA synthetase beta subunit
VRLHEYQSKQRLTQFSIPVPQGKIASTPQEVYEIALELNSPIAIKAQVLMNGRGKAGGILFASNPEEAPQKAKLLLGRIFNDVRVEIVLVETAYNFISQIYLGIIYDRSSGKPVMMASLREKAEFHRYTPGDISVELIHPILGLHHFQARNLASAINLPYEYWSAFTDVASNLSRCYLASDAALIEINPLVITDQRQLVALDARIHIDDYALFRQTDVTALLHPASYVSKPFNNTDGIHLVELNGCIGCLTNGSGLAMATMDAIQRYTDETIKPGLMIDLGSEVSEAKLQFGLETILAHPEITVLLMNVFEVVIPSDQTARIILRLLDKVGIELPIIIRLAGENADEGLSIIRSANLPKVTAAQSFKLAASKAIEAARGTVCGDLN